MNEEKVAKPRATAPHPLKFPIRIRLGTHPDKFFFVKLIENKEGYKEPTLKCADAQLFFDRRRQDGTLAMTLADVYNYFNSEKRKIVTDMFLVKNSFDKWVPLTEVRDELSIFNNLDQRSKKALFKFMPKPRGARRKEADEDEIHVTVEDSKVALPTDESESAPILPPAIKQTKGDGEIMYSTLPPPDVLVRALKDNKEGAKKITALQKQKKLLKPKVEGKVMTHEWSFVKEDYSSTLQNMSSDKWSPLTALYILGWYITDVLKWSMDEMLVTTVPSKGSLSLRKIAMPLFESVGLRPFFSKATSLDIFVVFCLRSLWDFGEIRSLFVLASSMSPNLLSRLFSSIHAHGNQRYALTWKFCILRHLLVVKVDQMDEEIINIHDLTDRIVRLKQHVNVDKKKTRHSFKSEQELVETNIPRWMFEIKFN